MNSRQRANEEELIARINANDKKAFKELYNQYWEPLFIAAFNLVKEQQLSEDILQEVFINIWTKRGNIEIKTSLKGYLYSSVLYKVYDHFRKNQKVYKENFFENFDKRIQTSTPESKLIHKELVAHINDIIETLPEKSRIVFKLSREEQLSHKEIAEKLNITTKTVEAHITKSLRILRASISNIASIELIIFLSSLDCNF